MLSVPVFSTLDATNCPLKPFQIMKGGSAYTGSCISIDATTNEVKWGGQYCHETGLTIVPNSGNALTGTFEVKMYPDCLAFLTVTDPQKDFLVVQSDLTSP